MRVLVTGGRDYHDAKAFVRAINALTCGAASVTIIEGGSTGADTLARRWAQARSAAGVGLEIHPADWDAHGRSAGPKRNATMVNTRYPDAVLAFPGGKGTANCVRLAEDAGVPVVRADADGAIDRPPHYIQPPPQSSANLTRCPEM